MGAESLDVTGVQTPNRQPVASRYSDYAIPSTFTTQIHDEKEDKMYTVRKEIQLKL
jgi:hypothetical protein